MERGVREMIFYKQQWIGQYIIGTGAKGTYSNSFLYVPLRSRFLARLSTYFFCCLLGMGCYGAVINREESGN